MYAMGWTQKSVGVQNIRAMSIIQLLLGNIGVAGGGVNALRGESNVQGSTDQALLADIWPGYLPGAHFHADDSLRDYNATTPKTTIPRSVNCGAPGPRYTASFLCQLYPGVTPDVAYSYVPRLDADKKRTDYMWMSIFDRMVEGQARRPVRLGHEPRLLRPERQQKPRGYGKAQVAGERQPVRQRNRFVLARPRQGPDPDRHGSLLPALLHVH